MISTKQRYGKAYLLKSKVTMEKHIRKSSVKLSINLSCTSYGSHVCWLYFRTGIRLDPSSTP